MIPLKQLQTPAVGQGQQYDPTECWADRRTPYGLVIGSCIHGGEAGLLGLCSGHYGEIVGWPA